jgi:hypothetical protein
MAAQLEDRVLDLGLNVLDTECDEIVILKTAQATDYASATGANLLGSKSGAAGSRFGSPAAATPNGRKVSSVAITDGTVSATGTAAYWAAIDTANSRLLAGGPLSATVGVTSGDTFTLATFDIAIPNQ